MRMSRNGNSRRPCHAASQCLQILSGAYRGICTSSRKKFSDPITLHRQEKSSLTPLLCTLLCRSRLRAFLLVGLASRLWIESARAGYDFSKVESEFVGSRVTKRQCVIASPGPRDMRPISNNQSLARSTCDQYQIIKAWHGPRSMARSIIKAWHGPRIRDCSHGAVPRARRQDQSPRVDGGRRNQAQCKS